MVFIIVNAIMLLVLLLLFLLLSGLWPPDSPWAPWWQMPKETIRRMCKLANVTKKSVIYDLGSGTGRALIIAAREFGATGVGIEIDPFRYLISKINNKRYQTSSRVTFVKNNFFDTPLSDATIVFMYLVPSALKRLVPKFLKEVRPGTLFVSYVYEMPVKMFDSRLKLVEHDQYYKIWIYQMQKSKIKHQN